VREVQQDKPLLEELIEDSALTWAERRVLGHKLTLQTASKPSSSLPPYGDFLEFTLTPRKIGNMVYCPVCRKAYPINVFYKEERVSYNIKQSDYLRCSRCRQRSYKERGGDTRIGRVSLDPTFNLSLLKEELPVVLQYVAEEKTISEISEEIMKSRNYPNDYLRPVSKKTILAALKRITPPIKAYVQNYCKPQRVDRKLIAVIFHFTRSSYDLTEDDAIVKKWTQNSAMMIVGEYSSLVYGFSVARTKAEAAEKYVKMAFEYTSGRLPMCYIKFDGSREIKHALSQVRVPESHMISVSKKVLISHINKIEGFLGY